MGKYKWYDQAFVAAAVVEATVTVGIEEEEGGGAQID